MNRSRPQRPCARLAARLAVLSLALATAMPGPALACTQTEVQAFIGELSRMSSTAEASVRYLIPKFRECGQSAIASELDGSPEWLLTMRQELQAAASVQALRASIDKAIGNLGKAEASLRKNYELVLKGIDSMYDNRFPPSCRRERTKIVDNMKATRPMVPAAIDKLRTFKTCLGA